MISCVQQFIVNPLLVSVGGVRWSRFVACSATYGESLRFRFALRWLEFDVPSATYGGTLRRSAHIEPENPPLPAGDLENPPLDLAARPDLGIGFPSKSPINLLRPRKPPLDLGQRPRFWGSKGGFWLYIGC